MANDVHLILKQGASLTTTVAIDVCAIAANLSFIDRRLKKAGQTELTPFFDCDHETWLQPGDVLSAFENARTCIIDADFFEEILFEVVVEQLGPAIDVLRALHDGSVIRLEIIDPKRRKPAKPKLTSTGSSGQAAASEPVKKKSPKKAASVVKGATKLSEQLTAKQCEYVQSLLEHYRCDADLWAFPEIERKARLAEVDKYSGPNHLDCLRRNLRQQHQVNDDECEAMVEINLFSRDILKRGVARRIAFNNLSDLRAALSLPFRMGSLSRLRFGYCGGGGYTDAWALLHTLAAKDIAAVRRFFEVNNAPLKGSGNRSAMLIYNAMLAIMTQNEALQEALLGPLSDQRKPVAVTQPIHTVLGGIITNDSSAVAAGLAQVMKNFRRFTYLFDEGKIICFEAHGLAELALDKNSSLLDGFDVDQGLPWDAAFFQWLRAEPSWPVYPEVTQKSHLLDKWLNRFEVAPERILGIEDAIEHLAAGHHVVLAGAVVPLLGRQQLANGFAQHRFILRATGERFGLYHAGGNQPLGELRVNGRRRIRYQLLKRLPVKGGQRVVIGHCFTPAVPTFPTPTSHARRVHGVVGNRAAYHRDHRNRRRRGDRRRMAPPRH